VVEEYVNLLVLQFCLVLLVTEKNIGCELCDTTIKNVFWHAIHAQAIAVFVIVLMIDIHPSFNLYNSIFPMTTICTV